MKDVNKLENSIVINENEMRGDKIIFDILIKEKLAHLIVIRDGKDYHINLDGEDLGYFSKKDKETINRYPQPKGAHLDYEHYFKPIEAKIEELEKSGAEWTKQITAEPKIINKMMFPKMV